MERDTVNGGTLRRTSRLWAAGLLLALAATAPAAGPARPVMPSLKDSEAQARAAKLLLLDVELEPLFKHNVIELRVAGGVAELTGKVPSQKLAEQAERRVREAGVARVNNRIKVAEPGEGPLPPLQIPLPSDPPATADAGGARERLIPPPPAPDFRTPPPPARETTETARVPKPTEPLVRELAPAEVRPTMTPRAPAPMPELPVVEMKPVETAPQWHVTLLPPEADAAAPRRPGVATANKVRAEEIEHLVGAIRDHNRNYDR